MLGGIGIDLVEIGSIEDMISSNERFVNRVFTKGEIGDCEGRFSRFQHYAARFAAKEAVMKALGSGWNLGVQWKDIEVVRVDGAAPTVRLHKKAKLLAKQKSVNAIHLSLSHSDNYATAIAILEA